MRLLARIIDGIVVGVVAIPLAIAIGGVHTSTSGSSASFSLYGAGYFKAVLVGLVLSGAYEVTMLAARGATLGKMAVGVRVADLNTGQTPSLRSCFIRWVIPAVAGAIFGLLQLIVDLSPFFDSTHRNRGWYDYAANTIAVRTK
jgi:uncharacterized RDD family membrane protein YckC